MSEEYIEEILDSPLVVHKESDASYQDITSDMEMNSTHGDENEDLPTLERHRFKKKKKSKKGIWFVVIVIAIFVGVACAVHYSGVLNQQKASTEPTAKKSYTTQAENKFKGVIVVKGSYIFFEGTEIDGINGLEKEIKYLDKNTKFTIWDEDADTNLLNDQNGVLSTLSRYDIQYEITHKVSSGLKSKYETTTTSTTTSKKSAKTTAVSAKAQNSGN
ncbi:MAG: hypothetical protein NC213_06770 [Acetobacter sp.]|nr:hypothetical protein [Bacteroides sp.]MCM1341429.1 hypothetical protein [Acetobacter sp.]MCM1433383.1 hypothetical protein [Clostridiales bacterium]